MTRKTTRRDGFTLIELVVTIAILTLLAGILVPAVGNYMEKGKNGKVTAELRELVNAITNYNVDTGAWPAAADTVTLATTNFALQDIPCFYTNTFTKTGWNGPYLNKGAMVNGAMTVSSPAANGAPGTGLLDPWGNPYYCYTFKDGYSGTAGGMILLCRGADGKANTSAANIFAGQATGDDILQVVTYSP